MYLSHRSVCLSVYLPVYLQAWKPSYSTWLLHFSKLTTSKTQQFCVTSSFFKVDNIKKTKQFCETSLIFWSWQHQKQSNSARLPHVSKLTTSKTKQFCETSFLKLTTSQTKQVCETSSFFELDNIQNEAILRDFFNFWTWQHQKQSNSARLPSKMESWVQSWQPHPNAFCDFSSPPVESTAPATKKWCQVIRSAAPVTQNHLSKPEDLMLQNAAPLRKSAPGPPNSSDEDVSCAAPATENASLQILFKCPTPAIVFGNATKPSRFAHFWQGAQSLAPATLKRNLNVQKWSVPGVFCTFWLRNVLRATTACTFSTSQLPKVVRTCGVLYIFTSKCASRHNGVHFFDISTSKSGPNVVVFCTFWLRNVLRATTACTFLTSQLPKVVREWCALYILTSKCALRHSGVQFFISHMASWLRTRNFSEPTFRPSGATNHWKNTVLRDFPTFSFAHLYLLSSDSFSSLIFSLLPFSLLPFSLLLLSSLWPFPSLLFICPYCRKFDF